MTAPPLYFSTSSGALALVKLLLPLLMLQLWGEPGAGGEGREGPGPAEEGVWPLPPYSALPS